MPSASFQLTPDVKYRMSVTSLDGSEVGSDIVATGVARYGVADPYTEYWSLTPDLLRSAQHPPPGAMLVLAGEPLLDGSTGSGDPDAYPTFQNPIQVTWQAMSSPPSNAFWQGQSGDFMVGIDFSRLVPPSSSGGAWSGSLTWYVCTRAPGAPVGSVVGAGVTRMTYSRPIPTSGSWYEVSLPPTAVRA